MRCSAPASGAPLREPFAAAIAAINGGGRPVLALDIPSGLDGDTGLRSATARCAPRTITFVALKQGCAWARARSAAASCCSTRWACSCPARRRAARSWRCLGDLDLRAALPRRAARRAQGAVRPRAGRRRRPRHAGRGAPGRRGGAARRRGPGHRGHDAAHAASLAATRPELMCVARGRRRGARAAAGARSVVAVGPGLGQDDWARALLAAALAAGKPLVLDADALNLLAADGLRGLPRATGVLTPHPGEAARLLGATPARVQADRRGALAAPVRAQRRASSCSRAAARWSARRRRVAGALPGRQSRHGHAAAWATC